jgi:hypothetical protein
MQGNKINDILNAMYKQGIVHCSTDSPLLHYRVWKSSRRFRTNHSIQNTYVAVFNFAFNYLR